MCHTTNENGQIDRLILNDVTGDLWTYGVLDDVKNLINNVTSSSSTIHRNDDRYHHKAPLPAPMQSFHRRRCGRDRAAQHRRPLWGLVDRSIGSSVGKA